MGLSRFRRLGRSQGWNDFEKPDIVETIEAMGVELTFHEGTRPYYNGCCPFHTTDSNNYTSFIVYPLIQQCECKSCTAMTDVIGFYMKLKGLTFPEAKLQICSPLSHEETLLRNLRREEVPEADLLFLAERANNLFERLDYAPALKVILFMNDAIRAGQFGLADQVLRKGGV